jgi:Family of unknown function (DUF5309)
MNANSYATPSTAGGNREDLRDILTILEPEETPFTSACHKGDGPNSTFIEVLADTLRAPRISGTREGQDAGKANNKVKNRQRFGSYVHRVQDEYGVTDVQQAISKRGGVAAIDNEYGNSKAKALREVKRDMEAIACSASEMQGGSDTDMQTRGIFTWIQSTAQSVQPVPASFRPPATAANGGTTFTGDANNPTIMSTVTGVDDMTEQEFNTLLKNLQKIYGGKKEYMVIAGDNITATIDNFTRVNSSSTNVRYQVTENANSHSISLSVSVFDSTFGRANVVPTQFNNVSASTGLGDPNVAYVLNMSLWQMLFLENLHSVDQDENAGGMSGYVKAMFALLCLNPKGNGKIYNA